jgi:hypothetical protein
LPRFDDMAVWEGNCDAPANAEEGVEDQSMITGPTAVEDQSMIKTTSPGSDGAPVGVQCMLSKGRCS